MVKLGIEWFLIFPRLVRYKKMQDMATSRAAFVVAYQSQSEWVSSLTYSHHKLDSMMDGRA